MAKTYIGFAVVFMMIGLVLVFRSVFDPYLHVVFCNVGQGDAILLQKGLSQILVDSGPDGAILACLGKHMPFFDRTIDAIVITHPQADHMNGFVSVLPNYSVKNVFVGVEKNETLGNEILKELIRKEGAVTKSLYAGDKLALTDLNISVVWPTKAYIAEHLRGGNQLAGQVLGATTDGSDLNGFGRVLLVKYGLFDLLLTADTDQTVEDLELATGKLGDIDVLKVPHHGSKTGMTEEWLDIVKPELAVIQVGKKNRYGHPAPSALEQLNRRNIKYLRTDMQGAVEVLTDGKEFWVH